METETIQYPKCGDVDRCRIPEECRWYGDRSQLRQSAVNASCADYSPLGDRGFFRKHQPITVIFEQRQRVAQKKKFLVMAQSSRNGYNEDESATQNTAIFLYPVWHRIPIDHGHNDEILILHSLLRILRSLAIVRTQSHSCLSELL